jgi:hypothetical protein
MALLNSKAAASFLKLMSSSLDVQKEVASRIRPKVLPKRTFANAFRHVNDICRTYGVLSEEFELVSTLKNRFVSRDRSHLGSG